MHINMHYSMEYLRSLIARTNSVCHQQKVIFIENSTSSKKEYFVFSNVFLSQNVYSSGFHKKIGVLYTCIFTISRNSTWKI